MSTPKIRNFGTSCTLLHYLVVSYIAMDLKLAPHNSIMHWTFPCFRFVLLEFDLRSSTNL